MKSLLSHLRLRRFDLCPVVGVLMAATLGGGVSASAEQRPPKPQSSFECSRFALAYNERKRVWECVQANGSRVAVTATGVARRSTGADQRTDRLRQDTRQRTDALGQEARQRVQDEIQDELERRREPAQRTQALRQEVQQRTLQLVREAEERRQEAIQRIEQQKRESAQRVQQLIREQQQRVRDLQQN